MGLFAKNKVPWGIENAPNLVLTIESFREAVVDWAEPAIETARAMDPQAKARTGKAARRMLEAQDRAVATYNSWYDAAWGVARERNASISPQAMVMLGGKAMMGEIEVQMTCVTSLFVQDDEFEAAARDALDTDWRRYTMVYGPVDEQANRRLWGPDPVLGYLRLATTSREATSGFTSRWGGPAGEVLAEMRRDW